MVAIRRAAALFATGEYTPHEVAALVGVSLRQVNFWRHDMLFREELANAKDAYEKAALKFPVARVRERMKALNDRWERAQRLIEKRAADTRFSDEPGYDTGLMQYKIRPTDKGVFEYEFETDIALLRELRDMEKQAAQMTGQWLDRVEHQVTLSDAVVQEAQRLAKHLGISVEDLLSDGAALLTAKDRPLLVEADSEVVE